MSVWSRSSASVIDEATRERVAETMRSSSVVVNDTDSLPLARGVATSVPVDTTTSSGSGPESQNVTPTRAAVGGKSRTPIRSRNLM